MIEAMEYAVAAGDGVLMNEQAALLRECRATNRSKEEVARLAFADGQRQERESCAKTAEQGPCGYFAPERIAVLIRARSNVEVKGGGA